MLKRWTATVHWYAETPEDDMEADTLADTFTDRLYSAVGGMEGVDEATVGIDELDTIEEAK